MLDFIDPDPLQALLLILGAVGVVVLSVLLWIQLQHRSRRYGGGNIAAALMAVAIVGLLVSISPNFLPFDFGIFVLILSLMVIYRPDQVIKFTGGPSLRYRALREGRELQLLVREHGGWSVAGRNEEVAERIEGLARVRGAGDGALHRAGARDRAGGSRGAGCRGAARRARGRRRGAPGVAQGTADVRAGPGEAGRGARRDPATDETPAAD